MQHSMIDPQNEKDDNTCELCQQKEGHDYDMGHFKLCESCYYMVDEYLYTKLYDRLSERMKLTLMPPYSILELLAYLQEWNLGKGEWIEETHENKNIFRYLFDNYIIEKKIEPYEFSDDSLSYITSYRYNEDLKY